MDGSMFRDLYKGLFWAALIGAIVLGGSCFGIGYAVKGCSGHPVVRWEKSK